MSSVTPSLYALREVTGCNEAKASHAGHWVRSAIKYHSGNGGDFACSSLPGNRRETDVRRDVARAVGTVVVIGLDFAARAALDFVAGEVERAVGVAASAGLAEKRGAVVERAVWQWSGRHQLQ